MPKMPDPRTGLLDPEDDPFRNCSGVWPHQRPHTLADEFTMGRARLVFEGGKVTYYPRNHSFNLSTDKGDR